MGVVRGRPGTARTARAQRAYAREKLCFVHPPIQCTAPFGGRNHSYATVRNDLTCQSVRGVTKRSLEFPALVHSTIKICLLATCQCMTPITATPRY